MTKIICKKMYNTETAALIMKTTYGYFGDPAGFEETLYQTPDGLYFLYVCGGADSPYPCADIRRIGKNKAQQWLDAHKEK
mgnify:CR=1 FL=1